MSENSSNWTIIGLAGLIGIAVGNLIGTSGGESDKASKAMKGLEAKVEALGAMSEDMAALGARVDSIGTASAGVGEQVSALMAEVEGVKGEVGAVSGQVEESTAIVSAVSAGLGMIGEKLNDMRGEIAALSAGHQAHHGSGGAATGSGTEGAAVAPEPDPGPSLAEQLAEELGEGGIILSVGQTAIVQEARVFLSKIAEGNVLVSVEGERLPVGQDAGSLTLDNGCTLSLVGVADRKAFIRPTCD